MTDPGEIRRSIGRSHALPPETVLKTLGVYPERGLDDEEAAKMRKLYGANLLPEPVAKSKLLLFLEQFNNPLIFVLFGAAVLTTIVSDVSEAITIFFVVVFNAIIGYLQEQRAGERLKAVKSLTAPHARLLRAGEQCVLPAEEVVIGDIVLLESGVRVPADLRLIETTELGIDESMLTGEPLPSQKNATASLPEQTSLGDRATMAFAGTTVRKGRARGVVVGVGETSEIGKISKGIAEASETISPLQERLAKFGKAMAIGIGVTISLIFGIGLATEAIIGGSGGIRMLGANGSDIKKP